MVGAFELYSGGYSRADGKNISYDDIKNYFLSADEESDANANVSNTVPLKQIIKDAICESNEDKIVFSLFNHDFMPNDVAAINMVLNIIAIVLAILALAKK